MRQRRWLLGALAGAVLAAWALWPRGRPIRPAFGSGAAASRPYPAARAGPKPRSGTSTRPAAAPSSAEARVEVIHAGLREWLRASRPLVRARGYDKDSQDNLQNNLLSLVTAQNAAAVLQSLSPGEMDSPLAVTATQRWLEADPAAAARWIASCPFATDDQAWAVARQAVADGGLMEELCAGPASAWKDGFLRYASLEVLAVDPAEAARLAQRMEPGGARAAILRQVGGAPGGAAPREE
ncbi:MAG TPA: hypothetical protein VHV47_08835 [Opitutaceae bacterium]|nr:hypothetical protein [Opitutaceae bacterium]